MGVTSTTLIREVIKDFSNQEEFVNIEDFLKKNLTLYQEAYGLSYILMLANANEICEKVSGKSKYYSKLLGDELDHEWQEGNNYSKLAKK